MKNVEHGKGTTWTLKKKLQLEKITVRKVQHGKYVAWEKCNMKRVLNKAT